MNEKTPSPEELNKLHEEALELDEKAGEKVKSREAKTYQEAISQEEAREEKVFWEKAHEVENKLKEKYKIDKLPDQVGQQLWSLKEAFGRLDNVKDKRILDLGCGAKIDEYILRLIRDAQDYENYWKASRAAEELSERGVYDLFIGGSKDDEDFKFRTFEPWFCRALLELGAKPVGIDIGNLEGEDFEHYQTDLSKPGALDFLPDKSFDGISMRLLLSSPQLEHMVSKKGLEEMKTELKKQIQRLLKEDGKKIRIDFSE